MRVRMNSVPDLPPLFYCVHSRPFLKHVCIMVPHCVEKELLPYIRVHYFSPENHKYFKVCEAKITHHSIQLNIRRSTLMVPILHWSTLSHIFQALKLMYLFLYWPICALNAMKWIIYHSPRIILISFSLCQKDFYNGCLWENIWIVLLNRKFWLNFKQISHRHPLQNYCRPVRSGCSSYRVLLVKQIQTLSL